MDIALVEGNPAFRIREQYQHLMGIPCPQKLKEEALRVFGEEGVSDKNAKKFRTTVQKEESLPRLQHYLTMFVLAADPGTKAFYTAGERAGHRR